MRKPEWLFVGAILLVGLYFSYRYFSKTEKFDPLQLVPHTATAVYEVNDPVRLLEDLKATKYWDAIISFEGFSDLQGRLSFLDSLFKEKGNLSSNLKQRRTVISLHVTGNESAGLMYYLPTGAGTVKLLVELLEKQTGKTVLKQNREYATYTIHELSAGDQRLTYLNYKNYFVVSSYGYLIEDIVRNINNKFENSLFSNQSELTEVPKLNNDAGNLYLNGLQLTSLYNTFMPPLTPVTQTFAKSIFLDVNITPEKLFLSGFMFANQNSDFASIFRNQEAGYPASLKLVSDNAASAMCINVSDIQGWYKNWIAEYQLADNSAAISENGALVKYLLGDISLISHYSSDEARPDKMVIARLADKAGALNVLNTYAESVAAQRGDTVYFESYADYSMGLIESKEYLGHVLGSPFLGFPTTYFMVYNDYLVLSSSSERIKTWLTDIDEDLIWGRSVDKNTLIEEGLRENTFALILSNPWSWSVARDKLNDSHKSWWIASEAGLKQFGFLSLQFANLDNRFYTEIKVEHHPQLVATGLQDLNDESLTQFTSRLTIKPKLVKNHNSGLWEVFMQDSTNVISLLDDNGELLWQESLGKPIVSDVEQIDVFKNRKLQYIFATDSAIHILDRNGVAVDGYPKQFSDFGIKDLFVVDYDRSRNYRLLITDFSGNLRMLDIDANQLEGWNPLAYNSEITDQVFHLRVRGKDRILVGLANGTIDLRNRRGEQQSGFPFDLDFNLENPLHFAPGSTFANSQITTVSKEGLVVTLDIEGNEYARTQLYQPSGASTFSLVIDKVRNDFIVTRQAQNRLVVLAPDGNTIFEKDYETNDQREVQYYNFGVDQRLYIVRNVNTGKVYLYNKTGMLVNAGSIYSEHPVSVVYMKKASKCYIYTAINQTVEVKSFTF